MSTALELVPARPAPGEVVRGASPSRPPDWWATAARWCARVPLLAAGLTWVADGGAPALTSPDDSLASLAMLTGLMAAAVALVQIALMARVPFVEASLGQSELARRHRLVGAGLVGLVLTHIATVAFAHPNSGVTQALLDLAWFTASQPSLVLAALGTLMLLTVAATSASSIRRRLRRRLPYELWHKVHLSAYLAVLLAVPHEFAFGDTLGSSAAAQAFWLGSYALVYGLVLVFRVWRPLWRSWYYKPTVARVVDEGAGATSIYIRGGRRPLQGLGFQPGQFGIWHFADGHRSTVGHPISLSAAPQDNELRITIKDVDGRRRWANMPVGTRVRIEGPYGRLTDAVRTRHKVALLASGTGITPIRALLEGLDGLDRAVTGCGSPQAPGAILLYRISHETDALFRAELDALAERRGCQVHYLVGHRGPRHSWLPEDKQHISDFHALLQYVPDLTDRDVYVCGPDGWMDAVETAVRHAGVPRSQLHLERFTW